jgi:hypothetical protein
LLSRVRMRCRAFGDSSKIGGIGWFLRVTRWCIIGCVRITDGSVVLCEVDGCCTLGGDCVCTFGAGVLMCRGDRRGDTLGGGSFSLSSLIFVAVLKMSASWRRAAVC